LVARENFGGAILRGGHHCHVLPAIEEEFRHQLKPTKQPTTNQNQKTMKNRTIKTLIASTIIATMAALLPVNAGAAEQKPAPSVEKSGTNPRTGGALPFRGKLDSVDVVAKSIKVGDRTFHVMTTTKITKDGTKLGTLDDAKVGEAVAGAFHAGDGGQFQLVSLRLGPKPEKKPASEKTK